MNYVAKFVYHIIVVPGLALCSLILLPMMHFFPRIGSYLVPMTGMPSGSCVATQITNRETVGRANGAEEVGGEANVQVDRHN